jgi:Lipase (class 3)
MIAQVRVYTFGSPRVGNDVFATFFGSVFQVRGPAAVCGGIAIACPHYPEELFCPLVSAFYSHTNDDGARKLCGMHTFSPVLQESYRVTHNRDIVPSVPLQIMGFHHVAREVGLAVKSQTVGTCMIPVVVRDRPTNLGCQTRHEPCRCQLLCAVQ